MRPPLGEYRTVLVYPMPLGGGIHRISSLFLQWMRLNVDPNMNEDPILFKGEMFSVSAVTGGRWRNHHLWKGLAFEQRGSSQVIEPMGPGP